ncbi:MAG: methyltransferase domain-containing protein [Alphaproteobacteria bacterium]|nr:methyltransferase domain-containing protein [Alphaproteobacteria bacterium]
MIADGLLARSPVSYEILVTQSPEALLTLVGEGDEIFEGKVLIEIGACTDLASFPHLRRRLFELGFLPAQSQNEHTALYVRSDLVLNPNLLSPGGGDAISMTALGRTGRFGNQLFEYAFLRLYALRNGLALRVPPWQGEELFGFSDSRSREGELCELAFDAFDNDDLALWEMDDPPRNVNFFGFFQEFPPSFRPHRAFLRRLFSLHDNKTRRRLESARKQLRSQKRTLVAIHIRRGDYVSIGTPETRIVPIVWYRDFLATLLPQLDNPVVAVATDGGTSVREQFADFPLLPADYFAAPGLAEFWPDFYALSEAEVLLLCNSSFSRMAALLAERGQRCFLPDFDKHRFVPYAPWEETNFWNRFSGEDLRGEPQVAALRKTRLRSIELRVALGRATHHAAPQYTAAADRPGVCKICGGETRLSYVVDFNQWEDPEARLPTPLKGWPVYYRRCIDCDFLFTEFCDTWDVHLLLRHIYNEEFFGSNPDIVTQRPTSAASKVMSLFPEGKQLSILDYGAGNIEFTQILRANGYEEVERFDFFDAQAGGIPDKAYDVVTCFDILDRVPDPSETLDRLAPAIGGSGIVMVELPSVAGMSRCGQSGRRMGPRGGRISWFTEKSLRTAFERRGLSVAALGDGLYIAFKHPAPFSAALLDRALKI